MEPSLIQSVILVAIGGAIGAAARFGTGRIIDSTTFPWATFAVNIIGSFLLALLTFGWTDIPSETRLLLFTGFFGAFTTMSTFSVETVTMLSDGNFAKAALNFIANPCTCVLGAVAGRFVALAL